MSDAEKTILFVTCINDRKLYAQCARHIMTLAVPPGYTVQFMPIRNAKSMTSGYNQAISHPAKYKVYIHQDVFIINGTFLYKLIQLFEEHEHLGMIGMIGAQYVPPNGVWGEGRGLLEKSLVI